MPCFMAFAAGLYLLTPSAVSAGPPYVTDDPEPVEYRHWEFYIAFQGSRDATSRSWSGVAPQIEVNYGALPNLQVHVIAPFAFSWPDEGGGNYGYGDMELGVKFRFIQETRWCPMIGTFTMLEMPTVNHDKDLGSGHVQAFFPLWLQKSFGPWTTYGGGGFWLNPGEGNHHFWLAGWQAQRKFMDQAALGLEILYTSPKAEGGEHEVRFNVGLVIDFGSLHHLLLSAGRGVLGPNRFMGYAAYQLTIGPASSEHR
jgi:hypothetical protein